MEPKQCNLCGSPMNYKEGYNNKKKKEWKGYFCQDQGCKNVEWVKTQKKGGIKTQSSDEVVQMMNFMEEEFANLNKRFDGLKTYLDALYEYLKKHLEKNPILGPAENEPVNIKDIPY